ncbi:MAG: 1-acyl-sn-glycerol-3-phosphate acyltransferase [Dehalococcoidia bacterium]
MPPYAVFARLAPAARKALLDDPGRLDEVNRRVSSLGARISAQYALLGDYDIVTFIDAPDNRKVAQLTAELSALGTVKLETLPLVDIDRFVRSLKVEPYRTEPHRWQTSLPARAVRRVGRYWVFSRYIRSYAQPFIVEGKENLDGFSGPAMVIGNHTSHFDTPAIVAALPERIKGKMLTAAAADRFYRKTKRGWWYSLFQGSFPVHRGAGGKQLEYPLARIKQGWSILIFPEGVRAKPGHMAPFRHGPTIMAMQAGIPIIPVYLEGLAAVMPRGTKKPRPGRVYARIGKPISLAGVSSVPEGTARLEAAMRELAGKAPKRGTVEADASPATAVARA